MSSTMVSSLRAFYFYIVTEVVPGPMSWSYFVPLVSLPTALMIPPTVLSRKQLVCFFLGPIYACTIHAWSAMGGVDVISALMLLWATFLIGLEDPRRTFRRVRNGYVDASSGSSQKISTGAGKTPTIPPSWDEPYPSEPLPRLRWVLALVASSRLTGWKIGSSTSHDRHQADPSPPPTRWGFLEHTLLPRLSLSLSLLWLTSRLARRWPDFSGMKRDDSDQLIPDMLIAYIPAYILQPLTIGFHAYAFLTLQYLVPTPFAVLSNHLFGFPRNTWSLHTVPPRFGPFTAVLDKGLAGLWGVWWHQVRHSLCNMFSRFSHV